jgi:hypothetical protein
MLRSKLRRYVNGISERFQGASPAKLYFHLHYRTKAMYHIYELGLDRVSTRSILDIGCGAGFFPYSTMKFGHTDRQG